MKLEVDEINGLSEVEYDLLNLWDCLWRVLTETNEGCRCGSCKVCIFCKKEMHEKDDDCSANDILNDIWALQKKYKNKRRDNNG